MRPSSHHKEGARTAANLDLKMQFSICLSRCSISKISQKSTLQATHLYPLRVNIKVPKLHREQSKCESGAHPKHTNKTQRMDAYCVIRKTKSDQRKEEDHNNNGNNNNNNNNVLFLPFSLSPIVKCRLKTGHRLYFFIFPLQVNMTLDNLISFPQHSRTRWAAKQHPAITV